MSGLRLAVATVLQARENFVLMIGFPCATFIAMSRSSTERHYFLPLGNEAVKSVAIANILASRLGSSDCSTRVIKRQFLGLGLARLILLLELCVALNIVWCIEQPRSSLLMRHPRCQQFVKRHLVLCLQRSFNSYRRLRHEL